MLLVVKFTMFVPAFLQIMAWHRPCDKLLSEPMVFSLLTHICVTRPHLLNISRFLLSASIYKQRSTVMFEMYDYVQRVVNKFYFRKRYTFTILGPVCGRLSVTFCGKLIFYWYLSYGFVIKFSSMSRFSQNLQLYIVSNFTSVGSLTTVAWHDFILT